MMRKKASHASFGNYDTGKSLKNTFGEKNLPQNTSFYNQQSQMTTNLPTHGTNDQSGFLLQRQGLQKEELITDQSYQNVNDQFMDDYASNNYQTTPIKDKMGKLSQSRRSKIVKENSLAQIKSKHAVNIKDQQRGLQTNYLQM